jgi:hypothetical protein
MWGMFAYRMELLELLQQFVTTLPTWGVYGVLAFTALYATLELVSIPVLPLTVSSGAVWGACAALRGCHAALPARGGAGARRCVGRWCHGVHS